MRSLPPYSLGGTASISGAICAIFIRAPCGRAVEDRSTTPEPGHCSPKNRYGYPPEGGEVRRRPMDPPIGTTTDDGGLADKQPFFPNQRGSQCRVLLPDLLPDFSKSCDTGQDGSGRRSLCYSYISIR